MTDIIKFVRWYLKQFTPSELAGLTIVFWMAASLLSTIFIGAKGLIVMVMGLVGILVSCVIYAIAKEFSKKWKIFKREQENEQARMVDRLKGFR